MSGTVQLDSQTILGLAQMGMLAVDKLLELKAARAARKLEVINGPVGPVMDDATFHAHFARWTDAADEASAHAGARIDARHADDDDTA